MKKNSFYYILTGLVAIIAIIADILSKFAVIHYVKGKTIDIIPNFFSLVYSVNYGAIFGTMKGMLPLFLLVIAVFLVIVFYSRNKLLGNKTLCISYGLVIGGALGNIIDRLLIPPFGGVTDFLDFHLKSSAGLFNYPVFNLADCFILVGAVILIVKFKSRENDK